MIKAEPVFQFAYSNWIDISDKSINYTTTNTQ